MRRKLYSTGDKVLVPRTTSWRNKRVNKQFLALVAKIYIELERNPTLNLIAD